MPTGKALAEGETANSALSVLPRNSACLPCRRRKLKCDAVRPVCANCAKPRPRADPKGEERCSWDDSPSSGPSAPGAPAARGRKRKDNSETGAKRARLQDLEERVQAFEMALKAQTSVTKDVVAANPTTSTNDTFPSANGSHSGDSQAFNKNITSHDYTDGSAKSEIASIDFTDWTNTLPSSATIFDDIYETNSVGVSGSAGQDPISDLFWPDWPIDLPSLEIVEHIINVFFDKVPTVPKMLHRSTFLASLQLPPSHPNFPAKALLHSILGLTAPHLPLALLATRAYFPIGTPIGDTIHPYRDFQTEEQIHSHRSPYGSYQSNTPPGPEVNSLTRFQMWHRRKAFQCISAEFDKGVKLLQFVQAHIAITHMDTYNAWWTDVWMEAGACIRLSVPLRLNESPVSLYRDDLLGHFQSSLLAETKDPFEQALRDRTWWLVYITERCVVMSTAWAQSLDDSEITVELPVAQSVFDSGIGQLQGIQTIHSPDLYSNQPELHADGLNLFIKALKLYIDVSRFFREYGRGSHSVADYLAHPSLRHFFSRINAFRLSFPPHLRRPTQVVSAGRGKDMDVDLVAAILVTHAVTLYLSEPLITKEMVDTDVAKMGLSAIRAVLSLVYDITATSFDLSLLPCSCSFVFMACGKGLVRFIDAATRKGDMIAADVYRSECEVLRMVLQQHGERYPLAVRHLKMLDQIIELQKQSSEFYKQKLGCGSLQVFDNEYGLTATLTKAGPAAITSIGGTSSYGISSASPASLSSSFISPSAAYVPTPPALVPSTYPNGQSLSKQPNKTAQQHNGLKNADFMFGPSAPMMFNDSHQSNGYPMGGMDGARQSLQGMDTEQWFDISNFTFDMDQLATLTGIAQANGAMWDNDLSFRV